MPGKSYEVPGASLGDGYVMPPASGGDAMLAGVLEDARAALDEWMDGEASLPPDPGLVSVRNAVRAEYGAAADAWQARKQAHYADPNRSRYKPEGLTALDTEFESALTAERAALQDRLVRRLDAVEGAVRQRLDDANVIPVTEGEEGAAVLFAAKLSNITPRNGGAVLADFVATAAENPGLAYEALPILRSLHDRGDWRGDHDLARAIETLQRVVEARPGAARAAADLRLVEETRRQIAHIADAAAGGPAPRFVAGPLGEEVPVAGHAGLDLQWSASPTAREMFGARGPSLTGAEPVVAAPEPRDDVIESWRPLGGMIPRGHRPYDE